MGTINVLTILGTRPEAVKLTAVLRELQAADAFASRVCITGQHRELIAPFLGFFGIEADWNLDVMTPDQSLPELTSTVLSRLQPVLAETNPDLVVVQGDTTTAFAATLAASYRQLPIAHVEAGLRSGDRYNPFPEEIHRRLIDAMAAYLFAPTDDARAHLIAEGRPDSRIWVTGNTAVDAVVATAHHPRVDEVELPVEWATSRRLIVATAHRRESFGADLDSICHALRRLAIERDDVEIVYPLHLNPRVRTPVCERLDGMERLHLIDPVPYLEFVKLLSRAHLVLTDSGGIQEEAPALGVPVLVMRRTTERPELIAHGAGRLVGTEAEGIVAEANRVLDDDADHARLAGAANPFGDGRAAERIVGVLRAFAPSST